MIQYRTRDRSQICDVFRTSNASTMRAANALQTVRVAWAGLASYGTYVYLVAWLASGYQRSAIHLGLEDSRTQGRSPVR